MATGVVEGAPIVPKTINAAIGTATKLRILFLIFIAKFICNNPFLFNLMSGNSLVFPQDV
ncbi:hypothetical protein AV654_28660 [Paenibacillus elgii]|uniref:Uncharacterized protein n=1 Tax=Paenibacillus elgii TaxID=189691 RepID=A0A163VI88_9BACL|nr:hypothetical protein AV654_28660 [Paenibacillus elgii]